jgi:hypothetical protein
MKSATESVVQDAVTTPIAPLYQLDQPLTSAQLAARLQISVRTLADWRKDNVVPFMRINSRCIRYRWHDVITALSLRRQTKEI